MLTGILSRKASIKVAVVRFCGTNKNFSDKYVYVTSNEETVFNYMQVAVACYKIHPTFAACDCIKYTKIPYSS